MSKETTSTTYELPDFLVEANDIFSDVYPISKALLHVKALGAQCYALKLLDVFDEMEDLKTLRISVESDGYLNLVEYDNGDGDDIEEDIDGYLEDLNDVRDDELLSFIESVFDTELSRDNVHTQIAVAYSQYCHGDDWHAVFSRRQVFLEARKLASTTEPTEASTQRPRARI